MSWKVICCGMDKDWSKDDTWSTWDGFGIRDMFGIQVVDMGIKGATWGDGLGVNWSCGSQYEWHWIKEVLYDGFDMSYNGMLGMDTLTRLFG